jgi:hypothetical protein
MKINIKIIRFCVLSVFLTKFDDCSAGKGHREDVLERKEQSRVLKKARIELECEPMDESEDQVDFHTLTNNDLALFCELGLEEALYEAERRLMVSLEPYQRSLYVRYKNGDLEAIKILLRIMTHPQLN